MNANHPTYDACVRALREFRAAFDGRNPDFGGRQHDEAHGAAWDALVDVKPQDCSSDAHSSQSNCFRRGQKPSASLVPPQRSNRSSLCRLLRRILKRNDDGALAETLQRGLLGQFQVPTIGVGQSHLFRCATIPRLALSCQMSVFSGHDRGLKGLKVQCRFRRVSDGFRPSRQGSIDASEMRRGPPRGARYHGQRGDCHGLRCHLIHAVDGAASALMEIPQRHVSGLKPRCSPGL